MRCSTHFPRHVTKLNCIPVNTQNEVLDRENKTLTLFVKYMTQIYLIPKTFKFVVMKMMMMIIKIYKLKMEYRVMRYAEFAKAFFIVKYQKI